jgi:hypothetical protein
MTLKKFNATLTQTLNGIDTYSFSHVCTSTEVATRFTEGATLLLKVNGVLAFGGTVKTTEKVKSGYVKEVLVESPLAKVRDESLEETSVRGHTTLKNLITSVLPDGFTLEYLPSRNPVYKYAFRSGSVLTHLNTLCAMSGMNWRGALLTATTGTIVVSEGGETNRDRISLVENTDLYNLKIETSLFKQYTQVTALGVEKEVSGYSCVASLPATIPYALLDCDDSELYDEELLPEGSGLYPFTIPGRYNKFSIQDAGQVKGWDGSSNNVVKINDEFIKFSYLSGSNVMGLTRGHWDHSAISSHVKDDGVLLTQRLYIKAPVECAGATTSSQFSPATDLFKIGTEIVRIAAPIDAFPFSAGSAYLDLATISATTGLYEGRGQVYDEDFGEFAYVRDTAYPHKQGCVITPYYPGVDFNTATQTLAVTIHGKGVVTKDGIDRLAWGTLKNIQNGIVSGSGTYKAGDFYDKSIAVGQKMYVTTASVMTGSTNVLIPATTVEVILYSIKREQNRPMTIEFGNVIPEVLNMLKSGEYALQAALRKQGTTETEEIKTLSMSGKLAKTTLDRDVRINW